MDSGEITSLGQKITISTHAYVDGDLSVTGNLSGTYTGDVPADNITSGTLGLEVIASSIAVNTVGVQQLQDDSITTIKLQDNAVDDDKVIDALTIDGGTINNTSIGTTTRAIGKFTGLYANDIDTTYGIQASTADFSGKIILDVDGELYYDDGNSRLKTSNNFEAADIYATGYYKNGQAFEDVYVTSGTDGQYITGQKIITKEPGTGSSQASLIIYPGYDTDISGDVNDAWNLFRVGVSVSGSGSGERFKIAASSVVISKADLLINTDGKRINFGDEGNIYYDTGESRLTTTNNFEAVDIYATDYYKNGKAFEDVYVTSGTDGQYITGRKIITKVPGTGATQASLMIYPGYDTDIPGDVNDSWNLFRVGVSVSGSGSGERFKISASSIVISRSDVLINTPGKKLLFKDSFGDIGGSLYYDTTDDKFVIDGDLDLNTSNNEISFGVVTSSVVTDQHVALKGDNKLILDHDGSAYGDSVAANTFVRYDKTAKAMTYTFDGTETFRANVSSTTFAGNVGIGTQNPQGLFQVGAGTLTVLSNGNIGIGTTNPGSKLDVIGTITGDGLTIEGTISGSGFSGWDTSASDDLNTGTSFGGDVSGVYNNVQVTDNSHNHDGSTISGLTVSDFSSSNVSQWINDSGYITDGNTGWDNSYNFITDGNTNWNNSYGFITDDTSVPKNHIANSGTLGFDWATSELASTVMVEGENISLLTNNSGYITDGNTGWDNTYGFITDGNTNWNNSYGFITDGNTNWDNSYGFLIADDLAPQYDSGWFAVSNNTTYTKTNTIGTIPSRVECHFSENASGTTVYIVSMMNSNFAWGYNVKMTNSNFYIRTAQSGVCCYFDGSSYKCPGSGYYRFRAWK